MTTPTPALRRITLSSTFALAALALGACVAGPGGGDGDGDGTLGEALQSALDCTSPVVVDPARSLFVTDPTALAQFTLKSVMDQILARGAVGAQTSLALYRQWWDTNNDAAHAQTNGPHCDDVKTNGVASINGFPVDCPRQEGTLAATNPFNNTGGDSYIPLGLVNRFDLAPVDGATCGEYRIVFGKRSGIGNATDRNLLIFEASLPNPSPASGIEGCRPVASFWGALSSNPDAASRAALLHSFYFDGLSGFEPVIDPAHYAGSNVGSGQIRANQFMTAHPYLGGSALFQQWQLREYQISRKCVAGNCKLTIGEGTVKNNPFGALFSSNPGPLGPSFQADFVNNQVASLVPNSVPAIGMNTPDTFNAAQSSEQDSSSDYDFQLSGNTPFKTAIRNQLIAIGRSDLTARNVGQRATTQSCAGCHQLSNGDLLGGKDANGVLLSWPSSNIFTQIDESSHLSPALTGTFLPHRKEVLESFLNGACSPVPAGIEPGARTLGGSSIE